MQVSLQYAEDHLGDLVSAVDDGQEVEIARPDRPTLKLITSNGATQPKKFDRSGMFGSAKGKIWLADDWDSDQNQ